MRRQRGGYWYTLDFKSSVGRQNAVRIPDGLEDHADATEQFGPLPNELPAWWLGQRQKGKFVRQDVAPGFIANNTRATSPDHQVHVAHTCLACHKRVVIPMDDYTRKLAAAGRAFRSPDEKKDLRLLQLYLTDLGAKVKQDQEGYDRATRACCGLSADQLAAAYARQFAGYHRARLTADDAARYWGVPAAEILRVLRKQDAAAQAEAARLGYATDPVDPVLAAFLNEPPDPVRREHFDEVTPAFFLAWRKYGGKP